MIQKETKNQKYNILALPKWYPSRLDPQLGIFLKKHILATALRHRVHVLYVVGDYNLKDNFRFEHTENENFTETIAYFSAANCRIPPMKRIVNTILYLMAFFLAYFKFVRKKIKPDFIHVHILGRTAVIAYLFKLFKGLPYIVSEQSTLFRTLKFAQTNFLYKTIIRFVARKASLITSVSAILRDKMLEYGFKNNYFVIPNVVEQSKNILNIKNDKIIILTVADLVDEHKNISDAILAMKNLKEKGYIFEYHIIGGGNDERYLKKLAHENNLLDTYVFFHGLQSNNFVLDFMQKCDFALTNSNYETFSVATAEALACGKPVISTRCGGPETFIDEQSGILIETANTKELQNALITMLETYQNYDSQKIQNSVIEKFSYKSISEQFNEAYQTLSK
jgi:glycosyltransferase involved in cell wall biosynthesis